MMDRAQFGSSKRMDSHAPTFIVTAELDAESFDWLNGLRQRYFPPERNVLNAHLTLFHHLDAEAVALIGPIIHSHASEPLALRFVGFRKLGRGVAVEIVAPELTALRSRFVQALHTRLTRQDSQSFRPHVTIQNKVDPKIAQALHGSLADRFVARDGETRAIQIWEYLGGPWKFVARLPLGSHADANRAIGRT